MKTYVYNHPLISDKLARLRDKNTDVATFRQLVEEVTVLMLYEVAKTLPTKVSPLRLLTTTECQVLAGPPRCWCRFACRLAMAERR